MILYIAGYSSCDMDLNHLPRVATPQNAAQIPATPLRDDTSSEAEEDYYVLHGADGLPAGKAGKGVAQGGAGGGKAGKGGAQDGAGGGANGNGKGDNGGAANGGGQGKGKGHKGLGKVVDPDCVWCFEKGWYKGYASGMHDMEDMKNERPAKFTCCKHRRLRPR